jgi:hypothetical protein
VNIIMEFWAKEFTTDTRYTSLYISGQIKQYCRSVETVRYLRARTNEWRYDSCVCTDAYFDETSTWTGFDRLARLSLETLVVIVAEKR